MRNSRRIENFSCRAAASDAFRRAQPLEVLGRKDLATTCQRLGLHTRRRLRRPRSGARGGALQPVTRWSCTAWPRVSSPRWSVSGTGASLVVSRNCEARSDLFEEQQGFFGQRGAEDDRAEAAARRVRHRLGAEAVVVANLHGGRGPEDRATLVPWGSPATVVRDHAPWPGRLAAPSPATTLVSSGAAATT